METRVGRRGAQLNHVEEKKFIFQQIRTFKRVETDGDCD